MNKNLLFWLSILICLSILAVVASAWGADPTGQPPLFPRSLESYGDSEEQSIVKIVLKRAASEPFNVAATLIFFCAIVHTFLTSRFLAISHKWEHGHADRIARGEADKYSVHHGAELFHFLGEVEAVFGIWAVALGVTIFYFHDWSTLKFYITQKINFTEPLFVVVIMTLAATRPILKLAEKTMQIVAGLLGGTLKGWWLTILTIGPLLGSLITEPAAMTISALLLASKFYNLEPSNRFKYATIGLLLVNISVGGTLTHFAAPPVLMVAGPWGWGMSHMVMHFGWKALLGILVANGVYYMIFKKEIAALEKPFALVALKSDIETKYFKREELETEFDRVECVLATKRDFAQAIEKRYDEIRERTIENLRAKYEAEMRNKGYDLDVIREAFENRFQEVERRYLRKTIPGLMPVEERPVYRDPEWDNRDDPVPAWVICVHVLFMAWTIYNAHYPALFIPGLLFFLGFAEVTSPYQNRIDLKPALLVGFFLGGLVIHGGVQGWWIAPVLGALGEIPLMLGSTILTAFNDNAAITYLSTLVPGFTDELKYAVVAGAVTGGGLTIIANAPNPAGQAILKRHFENGVSPMKLLLGALLPTAILFVSFLIF
ncbi:MAG: putative membrane protein [Olavius algarvensis Delta 4 endosymbiont]|nr:MAG: putative membrane protein [Olavius algarvensis Delta 4 endosymbiont]